MFHNLLATAAYIFESMVCKWCISFISKLFDYFSMLGAVKI